MSRKKLDYSYTFSLGFRIGDDVLKAASQYRARKEKEDLQKYRNNEVWYTRKDKGNYIKRKGKNGKLKKRTH